MDRIDSISWRRILNSPVEFTTEFILKMADGTSGAGSSSMGETISIYDGSFHFQEGRHWIHDLGIGSFSCRII